MIEVELTRGKVALIDDDDFDIVNLFKWNAMKCESGLRPVTTITVNGIKKTMRMHRMIMNAPKGMVVDHINHDTLDNRKQNLRICTIRENNMNRLKNKKSSSRYKGIYWHKQSNRWKSQIRINNKKITIGYFHEEEAAAQAYDIMARKHFGEFALLNGVGIIKEVVWEQIPQYM